MVNQKDFISNLGVPLSDIVAFNNKQIFASENINLGKFKLLNEEVNFDTSGLLNIKEIYGYAPEKTYLDYDVEVIQFPGIYDTSITKSASVAIYYDTERSQLRFSLLDGSTEFNLGDNLSFFRGAIIQSGNYVVFPASTSTPSTVLSKERNSSDTGYLYYCSDASWYIKNTNGPIAASSLDVLSDFHSGSVTLGGYLRESENKLVPIIKKITFSETIPTLDDQIIIRAGENVYNQINDGTVPNTVTWWNWVKNGTEICLSPPEVNRVYQGLYKKIAKY